MPTLMLVDDNPCDIDLLQEAFSDLNIGFDFMVAKDGIEAFSHLKQVMIAIAVRPAAILLDLNMPRVSGREVLAFIKGTAELASIPTIILTSSASPTDKADCLADGADAYFTKPNTLAQLNVLVRQIHGVIGKGPDPARFEKWTPAGGAMAMPDLLAFVVAMCRRIGGGPVVRPVR